MIPAAQGAIELAQARVSARFGTLPDEALWARLGALRDHAMLLDCLRGSVLARWVRGIAAGAGVHAIEFALRRAWRAEVREVASWTPPSWHEAVLWWSTWLDLALLQHVARRAPAPEWLADDPFYREPPQVGKIEAARLHATRRLLAADNEAAPAWVTAWRERCVEPDAASIVDLARLLVAARALPGGIASSKPAIHARRRALALLFRRTMLEPAAAFCYLAIVAIDLERLRGELARSVLFDRPRRRA